jgi:hypothetical protein
MQDLNPLYEAVVSGDAQTAPARTDQALAEGQLRTAETVGFDPVNTRSDPAREKYALP